MAGLPVQKRCASPPNELSSGQTQLFRLSCAFFRPTTTLLLDEPEQRLDTAMRVLVGERVRACRAGGTAVVLACHDLQLSKAVADYIVDIPLRSRRERRPRRRVARRRRGTVFRRGVPYIVADGREPSTLRSLAYPLSLMAIVGLTYGFTLARLAFVTNPAPR